MGARPLAAVVLAAAAVLASAPAARSELAVYDAGADPGGGLTFSADGYHYAHLESSGGESRWIVDGRPRARTSPGVFPACSPALSADGGVLLHLVAVAAKDERGVAAAVNGRRAGGVYQKIQDLRISAGGANAAYAALTPKGWVVVSAQGVGPAFAEPPLFLAVDETSTLYVVAYGQAVWLYRDHRPVKRVDYSAATASPDLRRTAGLLRAGAGGAVTVEVDGERFGPYASASLPVFSANGAHFAFLASSPGKSASGYDILIVDGRSVPMRPCGGCSVAVDDRGRAFQDVILTALGERAQIHSAYHDGRALHPGGQPPRVGLAPGGRHYVYPMLAPQGLVVGLDGRVAETGASLPLVPAPCVFDGDEYHYWSTMGSRLLLVCGHADGPDKPKTRCASVAQRAGWPRSAAVERPRTAPVGR